MSNTVQDNAFGREFLERITEWVNENMDPEYVFDEKKLAEWAEANGYIKEYV